MLKYQTLNFNYDKTYISERTKLVPINVFSWRAKIFE